ncbi:MAG: aminotransferase class V-fold PLP-dependent enzyme [Synechococcaceae cyanobacterium]
MRACMPALANKSYFNYGGQGPLPTPSLEAIVDTWQRSQELGPFTDDVWPLIGRLSGDLRSRLAAWCGVPPTRVTFTENVTMGCVLPLWGLPWQSGDEILLGDAEHPGVVAACRELAHRLQLTITSLPVLDLSGDGAEADAAVLARLDRSLSPRTRLVVLSHLLWNSGRTLPIEAVAERLAQHPRRPWLLVDAAQSLGSLPVAEAARAADIYACTGHKWCCGPEGLGVVVLSERLLEEARPTLIGWRSLQDESKAEAPYHRDGRRFEVATSCTPLMAGLARSLELLEAEGDAEARLTRIRAASSRLWRGLQALPGVLPLLPVAPPAGLVSFTLQRRDGSPIEPASVVRALGAQGLWLRSLPDPVCLRACTHITTLDAEVDRLLAALAALVA